MSSNINERISKLESDMRALYEKYDILADRKEKTDPRSKAKAISDGEIEPEFLGDMSLEAVKQMIFSIENTKESSRTSTYGKNWKKRLVVLKKRKAGLEKK
jgi:hypothetical protein